ncbi:MAG: hypothetical protein U1F06_08660 [Steroidobacteraceae bacterium]
MQRLGYRALEVQPPADAAGLTILMRAEANQAGVAPASAWLGRATDGAAREQVVMNCVGCHQLPRPRCRAYARSMAALPGADAASAEQGWRAIVHYMNYLSAWEFGRAGGHRTRCRARVLRRRARADGGGAGARSPARSARSAATATGRRCWPMHAP